MGRWNAMGLAALALAMMATASPAQAGSGATSQLLTLYHPDARAPTVRERLIIPTMSQAEAEAQFEKDPAGSLFAGVGPTNPDSPVQVPIAVEWARTVPATNRGLLNCIALSRSWNADLRAVTGTIENMCRISIRIRGSYGFRSANGKCMPVDRMDGVLMPAFGRKPLAWQGSDDKTQVPCIAQIEIFGVPKWPVEVVRQARGWLQDEINDGKAQDFNVFDEKGNTDAEGSGSGNVTSSESNDLCVLTLVSPNFGAYKQPTAAAKLTIHWANVSRVEDLSYNLIARIVFKDAVGHQAWQLGFSDFNDHLSSTGFDGTVAMSMLSEYCRAADAP